jgi:3-hydroxypropionate dehydrogenase (NADP+)
MKKITKIGCIGAGLVGRGWATLFSSAGYEVILYDLNEDVLEKALRQIKSDLMFLETNELLPKSETEKSLKRIKMTGVLAEAVVNADYIQESVFDNYDSKKKIFKEMDEMAPKSAILSSSTSGLLMTEIQKAVAEPERCVLAHPYLPVHLMPLVEVVGGRQTASDALTATCGLMEKIGKTPVLLKKEVPGYIVNRLQAALLREAIDLVDSGVASAEEVDKAFCLSAGLRGPLMGPLLRAHLAGDGIERFFTNYSQSYRARWESMATWHSISSRAENANIESVNEMKVVRTKSLDEIKSWRDEKLVKILRIIREDAHCG